MISCFLEVPVLADDDLAFILAVRQSLADAALVRTDEAWLIKIDRWFGEAWLGFSGKVLGALGVWRSDLTLPPFNPHRVRFERHFTQSVGDERCAWYSAFARVRGAWSRTKSGRF